eukprot:5666518-Amphidinium_carterae.1
MKQRVSLLPWGGVLGPSLSAMWAHILRIVLPQMACHSNLGRIAEAVPATVPKTNVILRSSQHLPTAGKSFLGFLYAGGVVICFWPLGKDNSNRVSEQSTEAYMEVAHGVTY